jgi:hydrogenase nickel incorporation protein HypA/HybF
MLMHEATLAQNIIEDIERRFEKGEIAGRVRSVSLSVGRLTSVVPENLVFLFQVLAKGSVLEGAQLDIERVPIRARCKACNARFEIEDVYFSCRQCGSPKLEMLSGSELIIESVEVD